MDIFAKRISLSSRTKLQYIIKAPSLLFGSEINLSEVELLDFLHDLLTMLQFYYLDFLVPGYILCC